MRSHRWTLKAEQDGSRTLVTQLGWLHAGPADVYASETASVSHFHNSGVFESRKAHGIKASAGAAPSAATPPSRTQIRYVRPIQRWTRRKRLRIRALS